MCCYIVLGEVFGAQGKSEKKKEYGRKALVERGSLGKSEGRGRGGAMVRARKSGVEKVVHVATTPLDNHSCLCCLREGQRLSALTLGKIVYLRSERNLAHEDSVAAR